MSQVKLLVQAFCSGRERHILPGSLSQSNPFAVCFPTACIYFFMWELGSCITEAYVGNVWFPSVALELGARLPPSLQSSESSLPQSEQEIH